MLGIDKPILISLINRGWVALSGPISIFWIINYLTPAEQGYFYTIGSIFGIQVLFELGIGLVTLQIVSHLMPGVYYKSKILSGDKENIKEISNFLKGIMKWYFLVASLFFLTLYFLGPLFLNNSSTSQEVVWQNPWLIALTFFSLNILCNGVCSFIEGTGHIAEVAKIRLAQSFFSILLLLICLSFDLKLYSLAVLHATSFLVGVSIIFAKYRKLLIQLIKRPSSKSNINWRKDILPFQSKVAVSWIAGYFGTQAIVPIVFNTLGAEMAGKFGMTISIFYALTAAAMVWITTKAAKFGKMIAQRKYDELKIFHSKASTYAFYVGIILNTFVICTLFATTIYFPVIADRFMPIFSLLLLGLSSIINILISSKAILLRAFKDEPFMNLSIFTGFSQLITVFLLSATGSIDIMIFGYVSIICMVSLFWANPLFNSTWKKFTNGSSKT